MTFALAWNGRRRPVAVRLFRRSCAQAGMFFRVPLPPPTAVRPPHHTENEARCVWKNAAVKQQSVHSLLFKTERFIPAATAAVSPLRQKNCSCASKGASPPGSPHRAPSERDAPFLEPSYILLSTSPVYEPPSRSQRGPYEDPRLRSLFYVSSRVSSNEDPPFRFPSQSSLREAPLLESPSPISQSPWYMSPLPGSPEGPLWRFPSPELYCQLP